MRDERREIFAGVKASNAIAFIATGLCAVALTGCGESSTAGVWTETESGEKIAYADNCSTSIPSSLLKTSASTDCETFRRAYSAMDVQGTAQDENGTALRSARIRLINSAGTDKETVTDENGSYQFSDVIYKVAYNYNGVNPGEEGNFKKVDDTTYVAYYDYDLEVLSSDSTLGSLQTINFEDYEKVSEGDKVYLKIPAQTAYKTVSVELSTFNFKKGDKVCLDNTDICHVLTADEVAAGTFTMEHVPEGIFQNLCAISVKNGDGVNTCAILDSAIVTKTAKYTMGYTLPAEASSLLDSLADKTVENVLVQITTTENFFMVSGNTVTKLVPANNSNLYWAEVTLNAEEPLEYNFVEDVAATTTSHIVAASESLMDTAIDLSFSRWELDGAGYSFNISTNGSDIDSGTVLLSVMDSTEDIPMGYEIQKCDDSISVCMRVYSGLDSVATDTTIYGKAAILDGSEHKFTFAVVGTHLTVAVDGTILRDTDLKVREYFTYTAPWPHVSIGNVELNNFVMFNMSESIHRSGETNWNRLKAWMIAHQQLSK